MDVNQNDMPVGPEPVATSGAEGAGPQAQLSAQDDGPIHRTTGHPRQTLAAVAAISSGIAAALIVGLISQAHAGRGRASFSRESAPDFAGRELSAQDLSQLDRLKPQTQAETLLEAAVKGTPGTSDLISARVGRWYGHLTLRPQLNVLVTGALNSDDLQVREAALDIQLAAYNLGKTPASVDLLRGQSRSNDHQRKVWALWSLGAMANRGVERETATTELLAHLADTDEDSRRWAVEGLSLVGTESVIEPLLTVMHDDPSPAVRERAACGLASSGMFSSSDRRQAVPRLINYTEDPALDVRTRGWAFQALGDITQQHLPNDPAAWRNWYENNSH